eukprot:768546-Hanusia_phi.AAC.4
MRRSPVVLTVTPAMMSASHEVAFFTVTSLALFTPPTCCPSTPTIGGPHPPLSTKLIEYTPVCSARCGGRGGKGVRGAGCNLS